MDELLQQGIAAFKVGKQDDARKIFITVVKQTPDSERAWRWMYQVSKNDEEKIHCLKQMLRINPKNEEAKQMLDTITGNDFPFDIDPKNTPSTATRNAVAVQATPPHVQQIYTEPKKSFTFTPDGEMTCPHCQKEVSINAHKCPYCHSDLTYMMLIFNPVARLIFIILFVFLGCPCLYLFWSIFR